MAPKRTASAPKSPTRAKKTKAVADPFHQVLEVTFAVIVEDAKISDNSISLLRIAAPFALKQDQGSRHKHQTEVADTITALLQNVENTRHEEVLAADAKVGEIALDVDVNTRAMAEIVSKEKQQREAREISDTNLKVASEAVAAGKKAHAAACQDVDGLGVEHERNLTEKAERVKLVEETWVQLKDGTMPGRLWRARDKLIDTVVDVLKNRDAEGSCLVALPVSLKQKPEQRGNFANKCMEYVEELLHASVNEMSEKIAGHADSTAEKARAVEEALSKLKEAEADRDAKENIAIEAENALLDITEARKKTNEDARKLSASAKESVASAVVAKTRYEKAKSTFERFQRLVEQGERGALPPVEANAKEEKKSEEVGDARQHSDQRLLTS